MGFLAVSGILFLTFIVGSLMSDNTDDDNDGPGGGEMIPATAPIQ